jgi:EAL domain-containing protein (putative c-di-GMP-specific phosphodiesterase class I)
VCFLVASEPGTRHVLQSVLKGLKAEAESFDGMPAMLQRYAAARPDLLFFDVTADSGKVRHDMELLIAAKVDCPIRIVSGLNGLLTEEIRRSWVRGGLKVRPALTKPLRQHAIKNAVFELQQGPERPRVRAAEVIDQGWFDLWYQPRINLGSNLLAGVEALFRAHHPGLETISAGELLEGVDEAALLNLTTRVLGRAMTDWKSFQKIGMPIEISINVPVCALKRLSLFSIFWEYGPTSPDWPGITLELSEDDIIPNMPFAFKAISELHKQKIKLAIDSFGLSYDELSRHQELPFSEIKIDRSFICNCDVDSHNAGLCDTIIDFAHRYGAKVVAQGVETAGELKMLRDMGCDYAQGYLLARPMSKSAQPELPRGSSKALTPPGKNGPDVACEQPVGFPALSNDR